MRIVAIVAALLGVAGAQASQPADRAIAGLTAPDVRLFGVVWVDGTALITRLDPATLDRAGAPLRVRQFGAWSFSPDRDRLAFSGSRSPDVRFVDMRRLETLSSVKLGRKGSVERIDWLGQSSVLVLYAYPYGTRMAWVDASSGRVLKRAKLGATPFQTASAGGRLVALLPPRKGIGTARLAIANAGGRVRYVRLPRIRIGSTAPASGAIFRRVVPGLAVDPSGAHAYVVGTDGVVADVNLRTLAVANHSVVRPRSLGARLGGWLVPSAEAKAIAGPTLHARWLGDGLVAVAGTSYRATVRKDGETQSATPLGLRIVDVRNWTQRTIDAGASDFAIADGVLLAYGVRSEWNSTTRTISGMGVAAYGPDGGLRFRLLPTVPVSVVQANGSRAYGWIVDNANPWHLVALDVAAGTVERELTLAHPTRLLLGDSSLF